MRDTIVNIGHDDLSSLNYLQASTPPASIPPDILT
jgi:hypothetical protein